MAPEATITPREIAEITGDLEIPCDYDPMLRCGPGSARWLMRVRCGCGLVEDRLACGPCKNILTSIEDGLECRACGEVFIPARRAFSYMEWLR